jgi:hypothetical protein
MRFEILDVVHVYYTVEAKSEAEAYKKISINAPYNIDMRRAVVADSSIVLIERLTNDYEETYDEFGVNTTNSFNTPPKEQA